MKTIILLFIAMIAFTSNAYSDHHSNENIVYGQLELGVGMSDTSSYSGSIGVSTHLDLGGYIKMGLILGDMSGFTIGGGIILGNIRDMTFYLGMGSVQYDYKSCTELGDECEIKTDVFDRYFELGSTFEDSGVIVHCGIQLLPEDNVTLLVGLGFEFD